MNDKRSLCKNNTNSCEEYKYEDIEKIANFLKDKLHCKPKVGIVCGSGLGSIGDILKDAQILEYKKIPNFPVSTVPGHAGKLLFGSIGEVQVVCMQGRFHFFEGYSLSKCTMPVRLMKLLGVTTLVLSNAAGGINSSYKVGDIMFIKDHINFVGFAGSNPLRGQNEEKFGPRFVALNKIYNTEIIESARKIAEKIGLKGVQEGVYACVGGPNFETVAELKALRSLGADAVGMSTVHEVITAAHCNMKCFAFSLITNECVMDYDTNDEPNHEEVMDAAKAKEQELKNFVENLVGYLGQVE